MTGLPLAPMGVFGGSPHPTGPGFALDHPEDLYHGGIVLDRGAPVMSLSTSRAKWLLPPSTPAHFESAQVVYKRAFDLGHAAHRLVLGRGAPIQEIPADDWRTKAAKELLEEARAAGKTPLKTADYKRVHHMADALIDHRAAFELLTGAGGLPEVSMWCQDPLVGVWLRGRADLVLPDQATIVDYKTTSISANPATVGRIVWKFHYELQAAWYTEVARMAGLDVEHFYFVFQETTAPYLVTVIELEPAAMAVGRREMTDVIRLYAECVETQEWPGYPDAIHTVTLPSWAGDGFTPDTTALEQFIEEIQE
jgi:hypothetical protein